MLLIYIEASKNSRECQVLIDPKLEFSEKGAARIQERTMSRGVPITDSCLRRVANDIIFEIKKLYLQSDVWFKDPPGSMNDWNVEVNITE